MPTVIEQTSRGERHYDIYSRLLVDRIIFLGYPIDDTYANMIIAQMLFLEAQDPERDVFLYINSPGGYIPSGLAIYDTMQYIRPDVRTICIGRASDISSLLLAAGKKGKRSALPNARIAMEQPMGGVSGQSKDIELQAKEYMARKDRLNELYALHTGKDLSVIARDTERIFTMSAQESKDYGIIDTVIDLKKPDENEVTKD